MDYILEIIKRIAEYSSIWMVFLLFIGFFIIIYKYKEEDESFCMLKVIGFYLLGSFTFNFNEMSSYPIIIPIGFVVYLYIKDKDRLNKQLKKKAAQFGFIMLCIGTVNGVVYQAIEYRDVIVKEYSGNIESIYDEWVKVKEKLNLTYPVYINDLHISHDKDKKIESISYTAIDYTKNKYYSISNTIDGYEVEVSKYNDDSQDFSFGNVYSDKTMIEVDEIIRAVSKIKFKEKSNVRGKDIDNYIISISSYMNETASNNYGEDTIYTVDESYNYTKAPQRYLPISGTIISYTPMEKVSEDMSASIGTDYYVIYPRYNTELIKDTTSYITINNNNEEVKIEDPDSIYSILVDLDFASWEEVELKSIDNKNSMIIKDDSNTSITIYKDSGYAMYEKDKEQALYKIPEYIREYIINYSN